MTDGVVVIDKPAGMTSHDVVDRMRKVFSTKKVGHAGTLDPDATGVLVLGLGRATRILSYAQSGPKSYLATAKLGITTSTLDAGGEMIEEKEVDVTDADVRAAASSFLGDIEQVPPMVSAVKIEGERLYKKARRGETVERAPRKVTIHAIDVVEVKLPQFTVAVRCSGGTFVRSLVADIGDKLGCGAHVETLRRTEAAGFTIDDAVPLDTVSLEHLRPVGDAVRELERMPVDDTQAKRISHGQRLPVPTNLALVEDQAVALLKGDDLLAVYKRKQDALVPDRVLVGGS